MYATVQYNWITVPASTRYDRPTISLTWHTTAHPVQLQCLHIAAVHLTPCSSWLHWGLGIRIRVSELAQIFGSAGSNWGKCASDSIIPAQKAVANPSRGSFALTTEKKLSRSGISCLNIFQLHCILGAKAISASPTPLNLSVPPNKLKMAKMHHILAPVSDKLAKTCAGS